MSEVASVEHSVGEESEGLDTSLVPIDIETLTPDEILEPGIVKILNIPVELVHENDFNPNEMDDATFNRLSQEIDDVGFIEPLQVVPMEDGTYLIIGGAHRFQVAKSKGWKRISCVILSHARWASDDLRKFETVRLNVLHGKLNPTRMAKLYDEMAAKYGSEALQGLFAYVNSDEWDKTVKKIGRSLAKSGLPKDVVDKFDAAAKEMKSVDDLSTILNTLFSQYGDTLQYSYMVFTYGNKDHIYVAMDKTTKRTMDAVLKHCKEQQVDINSVIGPLTADWVKNMNAKPKVQAEEPNPYLDKADAPEPEFEAGRTLSDDDEDALVGDAVVEDESDG